MRDAPGRLRLALVAFAATHLTAWGAYAESDALARRASWAAPSLATVVELVRPWIDDQAPSDAQRAELSGLFATDEDLSPGQLLERTVRALSIVNPLAGELLQLCQQPRSAQDLPELAVFQDESLPGWAQANLHLYYGCWLANQQLYDESHAQLEELQPDAVVDPAALLFFQGVTHYRRLEKDRALEALTKLLENESQLPRRYVTLARLMQAEMEPLKPDSLVEIERLMDNIKVRLGHGRAGKRVRGEEQDVIAKLDKLIEQLEQQAGAAASGAGAGSAAPSTPMEDSMPGQNSGPGNVEPKQLGDKTDWGNLPPKEREEALQQLSKDLPSHYRDVIEEYFRKLARDREE